MNLSAAVEPRTDPSAQAPEYVRKLAPYVPGKPVADLAREFGLAERDIVKLASNENPRGPSAAVRAAIAEATDELNRYPDGNGFALKAALSQRHGVAPDRIVLGNGSNDILELATQAFLRPGDHAVYAQHAFAVYPLAVQARGATGIEVPARDYGHDLPAMRAAITRRDARRVRRESQQSDGDVDRAGGAGGIRRVDPPEGTRRAGRGLRRISSIPRRLPPLRRVDGNLCQPDRFAGTFSKAYGLAALRVGYRTSNARGRGDAEPRAPAVQRQLARAGRGARGARRHGLRRREPHPQPRRQARARGRRPVRWASRSFPRTATSC